MDYQEQHCFQCNYIPCRCYGNNLIQATEQVYMHEMLQAQQVLINTISALETFIHVKTGFTGSERFRDKMYRTDISSPQVSKKVCLGQMYLMNTFLDNSTPMFRNKLMDDYYRWIDAYGAKRFMSDEDVKSLMLELHDVIKGEDNRVKITMESQSRLPEPDQVLNIFKSFTPVMNKSAEMEKDKTPYDINKVSYIVSGDAKAGLEAMNNITNPDVANFIRSKPLLPEYFNSGNNLI